MFDECLKLTILQMNNHNEEYFKAIHEDERTHIKEPIEMPMSIESND